MGSFDWGSQRTYENCHHDQNENNEIKPYSTYIGIKVITKNQILRSFDDCHQILIILSWYHHSDCHHKQDRSDCQG